MISKCYPIERAGNNMEVLRKPENSQDMEQLTGTRGLFQVETEKRGTGQGRKTELGYLGDGREM